MYFPTHDGNFFKVINITLKFVENYFRYFKNKTKMFDDYPSIYTPIRFLFIYLFQHTGLHTSLSVRSSILREINKKNK